MFISILLYILAWVVCVNVVAFIILFKGSWSRLLAFSDIYAAGPTPGENPVHLQPFSTIGNYLTSWSNWFHRLNIIANIAVFVPVGILIGIVLKGKTGLIVAIIMGAIFSYGLETVQYMYAIGSFDVDDIILNTIGAAVGYLLTRGYVKYAGMIITRGKELVRKIRE
ncbi:MAG: VanZ family protein [Eubacteriales bacterium]